MTEKQIVERNTDGAFTSTGLDPYWLLKNDPRGFFGAHNVKYINDNDGISVSLVSLRKLEAEGLSEHVRVCGVTSHAGYSGPTESPTFADLVIDLDPDTPCGKRHYVKLMVVDKYGVAVSVDDKKVVFYTPLEDFVEYCAILAGKLDVNAVRGLEAENAKLKEEVERAKKALELTDSDRSCTGVERDSLREELQKVKEENLSLRETCYAAARLHGISGESLTNLTNDLADRYRAKCREMEARIKDLEDRNSLLEDNLKDVIEDRDAAKDREKKLESALIDRARENSWGDDDAPVDHDLMGATILFANDMYHLMAKAIKEEPYKSAQNCPDTPAELIKPSTWACDNATKGTLRALLRYIYSVWSFLESNGFSVKIPDIPDKIAQAICHPSKQVKGVAKRWESCCDVLKPAPRVTKELLRHAIDHAKRMLNKLADAKSRTDWYSKRMRELHFKDAPQPPSRLLAVLNDNEPVKDAVAVFEDIKTFTFKVRAFLQYMGYTGTIPAIHPDLRDEFGKEFTLANGVTVPAMEVLSPAQLTMTDKHPRELLNAAIAYAREVHAKLTEVTRIEPWCSKRMRELCITGRPSAPEELRAAFCNPAGAGLDIMKDIRVFVSQVRVFLHRLKYPGILPPVPVKLKDILGKKIELIGDTVPELFVEGSAEAAMADNSVAEMRLLMENAPVGAKEADRLEYIAGNKDKTPLELASLNGLEWKLLKADELFGPNPPSMSCAKISGEALDLAGKLGVRTSSVAKNVLMLRDAALDGRIPSVAYLSAFLSCMIDLLANSKKCGRFDMELENVVSEICKAYIAGNVAIGEAVVMMQQIVEHLAAARPAKEPDNTQASTQANNILGALLIMSLLRKKPKKKNKK